MKVVSTAEGEVFDIELEEDILQRNRQLAELNRQLLDAHGIIAIDVMGSVGTGKTSLVQQMAKHLKGKYRMAAIAGDLTTTIDADRIQSVGVSVIQVNTGKECHLDANLVKRALEQLELDGIDLIFIENVGNLICPAEFPLGAHKRLVVISVTEGPYMVVKHPYIFMDADAVAINKTDLAKAMGVEVAKLKEDVQRIRPGMPVITTNGVNGGGIDELVGVLSL